MEIFVYIAFTIATILLTGAGAMLILLWPELSNGGRALFLAAVLLLAAFFGSVWMMAL